MAPRSARWRCLSHAVPGLTLHAIAVTALNGNVQEVLGNVDGFINSALPSSVELPSQAQFVDPASFAALPEVHTHDVTNATTIFIPPGSSMESLADRPFHIYHPDFLAIIGSTPSLTLIAEEETNPLFHEAVVWHSETDDVFFAQNAGARAAGTGLHVSAIIQKISVKQAVAVSHEKRAVGKVTIETVPAHPPVINPNGGTNYQGDIIFAGEGMGDKIAPALYVMSPSPPYNTTTLVNNYFGRQFNSLNDVAVHPINRHIYFTDVTYGFLQDFRPKPGLPNQVYRLNPHTKAVTVVADDVPMCNGITFSPDGRYAYITDTSASQAFNGYHNANPSAIYRYEVTPEGTFHSRHIFAHVATGIPDGIHCDSQGNVYSGCGDGVHVWNPAGTLLGKIFTGSTVANFQFAGDGRMVVCAETRLFFATLAAKGAPIQ